MAKIKITGLTQPVEYYLSPDFDKDRAWIHNYYIKAYQDFLTWEHNIKLVIWDIGFFNKLNGIKE